MWSDGPNLCRSEWCSGELWVPSNVDERLNFPPVISWGDSSFLRCLCCIINGKQSLLQNNLHVLHDSLLGSHVIQLHCLTNHCISQLLDNLYPRLQINLFHQFSTIKNKIQIPSVLLSVISVSGENLCYLKLKDYYNGTFFSAPTIVAVCSQGILIVPLCYMQTMHVYLPLKAPLLSEKMKTI